MSHTPTPWKVHAPRDGWVSIHGPNGEEIVDLNHSDGSDEPVMFPGHGNAEFIVRACNVHDEMKDALENLVIAIGMGWDLEGVVAVANAALAKVEGRS